MSKTTSDLDRPQPRVAVLMSEKRETAPTSLGISTAALIGAVVLGSVFFANNTRSWQWFYQMWTTSPDNSHGLLVPVFAVILLWLRRNSQPLTIQSISTLAFSTGLALILVATAMKCAGIYCRIITLEAASIIPCLAGIVLCCGGWPAMRLAWPSLVFLVFMIPLPQVIGSQLAGKLQYIATFASTHLLQLVGVPAVSEGNVIFLPERQLGVAEACSGIRMMMSFFALTTALCFVVERAIWEKALIWLSAPVIAVVANVLRITVTGLAYEFGSEKLAELVFHDLAGWLMMPAGLLLLWIELFLLARMFPMVDEADLSISLRQSKGSATGLPRRSVV